MFLKNRNHLNHRLTRFKSEYHFKLISDRLVTENLKKKAWLVIMFIWIHEMFVVSLSLTVISMSTNTWNQINIFMEPSKIKTIEFLYVMVFQFHCIDSFLALIGLFNWRQLSILLPQSYFMSLKVKWKLHLKDLLVLACTESVNKWDSR